MPSQIPHGPSVKEQEEKYRLKRDFAKKLEDLINLTCQENDSNTPDFILADYIMRSLLAFNLAVRKRDDWYGAKPDPDNIKLVGVDNA